MSFILGPFEALESGLFERKPDVPDIPKIDLPETQMTTARGNLAALPTLEDIGAGVNAFQRGERAKTIASSPYIAQMEKAIGGNLDSWLSGVLTPDVRQRIASSNASRAMAGGFAGSPMAFSMDPLSFGLTSLDLQRMAMPMASQFMGQEFGMRNVPQFDPTSEFLDPMQVAQFNANQNAAQWQRNWLANRIAAQPEPWQQSIMNSTEQGGAIFDKLFSGALGSSAGGGLSGGSLI